MNEALMCDHSNESYWAVPSCGTVYYPVHGGSTFLVLAYDHSELLRNLISYFSSSFLTVLRLSISALQFGGGMVKNEVK